MPQIPWNRHRRGTATSASITRRSAPRHLLSMAPHLFSAMPALGIDHCKEHMTASPSSHTGRSAMERAARRPSTLKCSTCSRRHRGRAWCLSQQWPTSAPLFHATARFLSECIKRFRIRQSEDLLGYALDSGSVSERARKYLASCYKAPGSRAISVEDNDTECLTGWWPCRTLDSQGQSALSHSVGENRRILSCVSLPVIAERTITVPDEEISASEISKP